MKRLILVLTIAVGLALPTSAPAQAIFGLGCSDAQKQAPVLARKMANSAKSELGNYKKGSYKAAYANYAETVSTYGKWYKIVTSKRKCFNGDSSITSTMKTMNKDYFKQVSMCDRYGMAICKIYLKPTYDPCSDYKYNAFDYEMCLEDQAREYGGDYVD